MQLCDTRGAPDVEHFNSVFANKTGIKYLDIDK